MDKQLPLPFNPQTMCWFASMRSQGQSIPLAWHWANVVGQYWYLQKGPLFQRLTRTKKTTDMCLLLLFVHLKSIVANKKTRLVANFLFKMTTFNQEFWPLRVLLYLYQPINKYSLKVSKKMQSVSVVHRATKLCSVKLWVFSVILCQAVTLQLFELEMYCTFWKPSNYLWLEQEGKGMARLLELKSLCQKQPCNIEFFC